MSLKFNWSDDEERLLSDISQINEALGGNLSDDGSDEDQNKKPGLNTEVHSCDEEFCDIDCVKPSWENYLGYNKVYQEVLKDSLIKLKQMLKDNLEHQQCLTVEIEWYSDESNGNVQKGICEFLYPYFRDKIGRIPKYNDDVLVKQKAGEKHMLCLKQQPWSHCELKLLKKSCIEDSLLKRIRPFIFRLEILTNRYKSLPEGDYKNKIKEEIDDLKSKVDHAKMNPKLCVFDRQEDLDWLKISAFNFDGCRSPEECELMWNNLLHPSINKNEWSLEEDGLLEEAINKAGLNNWDFVAELMKTNRSPYQCFVRYRTAFKTSEAIRPWTKEEDSLLSECVNSLKVGSYIPWIQVQQFLKGRTKLQIYHRWKYVLNPSIKKGQFSTEEDVLILAGVELFKDDFLRIAHLLPGRTSCQIRKRYRRLQTEMEDNFGVPWTRAEDLKLIEIVKNQNLDTWRTIAEQFPGRDAHTCHRRFLSICKNSSKNPHVLESKTAPLGAVTLKKRNPKLPKRIRERVAEVVNDYKNKNFTQKYVYNQKPNVDRKATYAKMANKLLDRIDLKYGFQKVKPTPADFKLEKLLLACGPRQHGRPYCQVNEIAIEIQAKAIELICHGLNIQLMDMIDFDPENREFNDLDNCLFEIIKDKLEEEQMENVTPMQRIGTNKIHSSSKPALSMPENFKTESESEIPHQVIIFPPNVSTLIGFQALLTHCAICSKQAKKLRKSTEPTGTNPIPVKPKQQLVIRSYTNKKKNELRYNPPPVIDFSNLSVEKITLSSPPSSSLKNKERLPVDVTNARIKNHHGQLKCNNDGNSLLIQSKRLKLGDSSVTETNGTRNSDEEAFGDSRFVISRPAFSNSEFDKRDRGTHCNQLSHVQRKNPKTYRGNSQPTPTVEKLVSKFSPATSSLSNVVNHNLSLQQTETGTTDRYKVTVSINNTASNQVVTDNGTRSKTFASTSSTLSTGAGASRVHGNKDCIKQRVIDPSVFLDDAIALPVYDEEAERMSDAKLLMRLYSVFYWPAMMTNNYPKEAVVGARNETQVKSCPNKKGNVIESDSALILAEDSGTSIPTKNTSKRSRSRNVRKREPSRSKKKTVKELVETTRQNKQSVTRKQIDNAKASSEPRRLTRSAKRKMCGDGAHSTTADS